MTKIAVTAASGKLVSAIVNATVELVGKENVVGLARTPSKAASLGVEIRPGDCESPADLEKSLDAVDTVLLVSGIQDPPTHCHRFRARHVERELFVPFGKELDMRLEPTKDEGQLLPPLAGMLICVLDTPERVDNVVGELASAGFRDDELILLHGKDGIELVQRVDTEKSYFSDAPKQLFCRDTSVLSQGKYVLGIPVGGGDRAREVADLVRPHGAHGFMHFGTFVDTRFE